MSFCALSLVCYVCFCMFFILICKDTTNKRIMQVLSSKNVIFVSPHSWCRFSSTHHTSTSYCFSRTPNAAFLTLLILLPPPLLASLHTPLPPHSIYSLTLRLSLRLPLRLPPYISLRLHPHFPHHFPHFPPFILSSVFNTGLTQD